MTFIRIGNTLSPAKCHMGESSVDEMIRRQSRNRGIVSIDDRAIGMCFFKKDIHNRTMRSDKSLSRRIILNLGNETIKGGYVVLISQQSVAKKAQVKNDAIPSKSSCRLCNARKDSPREDAFALHCETDSVERLAVHPSCC